jgi:hypothetical protein
VSKYPTIPEPSHDIDGILNTVTALKQTVEIIAGLRQGESIGTPQIFYQTYEPSASRGTVLSNGDIWLNPEGEVLSYWKDSTKEWITSGGNSVVDLSSDVTGDLPVGNLDSGTSASASTFWRGDGTWAVPSGLVGSVAWGSVTGTLSSQTDLQSALDGKQAAGSYAAAGHTHTEADITDLGSYASDGPHSHRGRYNGPGRVSDHGGPRD